MRIYRLVVVVSFLLLGSCTVTQPAVNVEPDPTWRDNWRGPLILQPGIPGEVNICTWDGFELLSCIPMKDLRELLKARQRV